MAGTLSAFSWHNGDAKGEDLKTVQELLRNANGRITLDVYSRPFTRRSGFGSLVTLGPIRS